MSKVEFHQVSRQDITDLISKIYAQEPNSTVSIIVEGEEVGYLIGGPTDFLSMVKLPLNPNWRLKKGAWSLSANNFKSWWVDAIKYPLLNPEIILKVKYNKGHELPSFIGRTGDESQITFQAKESTEEHLKFLEQHKDRDKNEIYQLLPIDFAKQFSKQGDNHPSSAKFEINAKKRTTHIEIDNNITIKNIPLPEDLVLTQSILLNKESMLRLKRVCEHTDATAIHCCIDDERAIFSNGIFITTSSLASLRECPSKRVTPDKTEVKIIIPINDLMNTIKSYKSNPSIKKHNEVLLYIDKHKVMLACITKDITRIEFIHGRSILCNQPKLYRIVLSQLSNIDLKGITGIQTIKIEVFVNTQGQLELGFYKTEKDTTPYTSITGIQSAQADIAIVQKLKSEFEDESKQHNGIENNNFEGDLFDFDDV